MATITKMQRGTRLQPLVVLAEAGGFRFRITDVIVQVAV
jgi:hypothetical protein